MSESTEKVKALIGEVRSMGKSGSLAEADGKVEKLCAAIEAMLEDMSAPVVAPALKKVAK